MAEREIPEVRVVCPVCRIRRMPYGRQGGDGSCPSNPRGDVDCPCGFFGWWIVAEAMPDDEPKPADESLYIHPSGTPRPPLADWMKRRFVAWNRYGWWEGMTAVPDDVLAEARRLVAGVEGEPDIRPSGEAVKESVAWLVYADWLDEHDLPLQAAALRAKYGVHE